MELGSLQELRETPKRNPCCEGGKGSADPDQRYTTFNTQDSGQPNHGNVDARDDPGSERMKPLPGFVTKAMDHPVGRLDDLEVLIGVDHFDAGEGPRKSSR